MVRSGRLALLAGLIGSQTAFAADTFKLDSTKDVIKSANVLAEDVMAYYKGDQPGQSVGLLPKDYYWWESASLWTTMINYWHLTGNDTYNDVISAGILGQIGEDEDFMPVNQTRSMGNDDQCLWALAAMEAVEDGFPEPSGNKPKWLDLATSVFEQLDDRVDDDTCAGGLRWQIFSFNNGYDYKNSLTNGCFFNLAARLARHTGNSTYAKAATTSWDWLTEIGFVDEKEGVVYDGATIQENHSCSSISKLTFSNTLSIITHGAAVMCNHTDGDKDWLKRVNTLSSNALDSFFKDGVAYEVACEESKKCNQDMRSYKGLLHRFLAGTAQLVPSLQSDILKTLKSSATAAVKQCTGGDSGRQCGFYWSSGKFVDDKGNGVGEELNVLSAVSNLLIEDADAPTKEKDSNGKASETDKSTGTPAATSGAPAETSDSGSLASGRVEMFAMGLSFVVGVSAWTSF